MNYQLLREQYEATKLDARIQYNVGNLVDMIATIDLDIRDQVVDELSFLLRDEEQDLLSEVYRELEAVKKPRRFIHKDGLFDPDGKPYYMEYRNGRVFYVHKDGSELSSSGNIYTAERYVEDGDWREITDEPGDPFENYTTRWFVPPPDQSQWTEEAYFEWSNNDGTWRYKDGTIGDSYLPLQVFSEGADKWIEVFERPELVSKPSKKKPSKKPTKKKAKK